MKILVVEDDVPLARFIGKGLENEHYAVDIVHDGEQARTMACEGDYGLVLLDLNLPKVDGLTILQTLRDRKRSPVLILTARTRLEDRVRALDAGADDCVLKPFSYAELSARVRALLRRGDSVAEMKLRVADLELDRVQRTVERAGKRIDLTTKEFALLEYLMRNAGQRVTRMMIMEHVWNLKFDTGTNVVDVYVNYFQGTGSFGAALQKTMDSLNDPTNGPIDLDLNAISQTNQDLTDQINDFEARLTTQEQQLMTQYSQINAELQELPGLQDQVSEMLGVLNPNSTSSTNSGTSSASSGSSTS